LGYAFLPLHLVEEELASGKLVRLPLWQEMAPYQAPIYLIWSQSRSLGQAGTWLMQELFEIKKAVGH
jgi:DNA-binding transcriptional LysR family regulator